MNYEKILNWASWQVEPSKWLDASIMDVSDNIDCGKATLRKLKDIRLRLTTKQELSLDHRSELISVTCDGDIVSLNFVAGPPDSLECGIMKRLGFKWVNSKREYSRKLKGADVEAIRAFIEELSDGHESTHNNI